MREQCPRSATSRAYYAAFAAIAYTLEQQGTQFPMGRFGPSHQNVPELVRSNLKGLTRSRRQKILAAIKTLYASRLDADYKPPRTVDREVALRSLTAASLVASLLGVAE